MVPMDTCTVQYFFTKVLAIFILGAGIILKKIKLFKVWAKSDYTAKDRKKIWFNIFPQFLLINCIDRYLDIISYRSHKTHVYSYNCIGQIPRHNTIKQIANWEYELIFVHK